MTNQKQLIIKTTILVFTTLCNSLIFAQFKNFGTKAKIKPEPNFNYSVYAYYDIIRESGVGFQYQLGNKINIDVSAYLINKQNNLNRLIKQWDYYEFKGFGFSLKPKYLLSRLGRFYVGANIAYESLHYDKAWVEYYYGRGSNYINHNLQGAKGEAYTIGLTLGNKMPYKHAFFEPFFGIGITTARLTTILYNENPLPSNTVKYPISSISKIEYLQMNIGIKIGYSFKRSKKHDVIDKKFDDVYIPKAEVLENYFKTFDAEKRNTPKNIKRALNRYHKLNGSVLCF